MSERVPQSGDLTDRPGYALRIVGGGGNHYLRRLSHRHLCARGNGEVGTPTAKVTEADLVGSGLAVAVAVAVQAAG